MLSDDVVIADQEVSKVYESPLATMGVRISYKRKNPIPHVVENRLPPGKVKFFRYDSYVYLYKDKEGSFISQSKTEASRKWQRILPALIRVSVDWRSYFHSSRATLSRKEIPLLLVSFLPGSRNFLHFSANYNIFNEKL